MSDTNDFNIDSFYEELWDDEASAVSPSLEALAISDKRYEKIGVLGEGGMKRILKVYDSFTCRTVALAELLIPQNSQHIDAFLHEARLTSQLDHPNIIQIHDIGLNEDAQPFYTMDMKVGQTLKEFCLSETTVSLNEKLNIFTQICQAISYAHSKDIIHLDLKPENIHIGSFGKVVVCDWGLGTTTKKLSLQEACEQPFYQNLILSKPIEGRLSGTPGFMAPEQYQHNAKKDKSSDLFSLGALLYFILTSRKPFTGALDNIKHKTLTGDFPRPSLINADIPDSLEAICVKALKSDRKHRYQSAEELHGDIQKYMEGFTTSAEQTGFIKETSRLIQRNKLVSIMLFSFVSVLAASTLFFINSLQESNLLKEKALNDSERAISLYEKEKEALTDLDYEYARSLKTETEKLRDVFAYSMPVFATEEALKKARRILERQPESDEIKRLVLYLSISSFKFADAEEVLNIIKDRQFRGISTYQDFIDSLDPELIKNGLPNGEEFLEVIDKFRLHCPKRDHLLAKMFIYYYTTLKNKSHFDKIVAKILHFYNPDWNEQEFFYDAKTATLKISGKQFSTIRMNTGKFTVNFLSYLELRHLDLSGTNFYSPSQLKGLDRVESLNISRTLVKQILDFKQFPHLNKLTISKKQFSRKKLNQIPPKVKVIIR